ncbi:MAG: tyrosine-type recombinase/integrase [Propionicimonas sp.]
MSLTQTTSTSGTTPDPGKPKRTRRGFGWVRKLPSGRYQASYLDPTGTRITAKASEDGKIVPLTFLDKRTAEAWLSLRQSEIIENRWKPPRAREPEETIFSEYADRWLASRDLSPRTRAEYRKVLDGKRLSYFSEFTLEEISPAMIKQWWSSHGDSYPTARRKAYDLLHAILATSSQQDEDTDAPPLIATNPARLSAKTKNNVPTSRPRGSIRPASLAELTKIMDEMPPRYAAMVLLAAWCAPRFGELTELRRRDLRINRDADGNPVDGTLTITRAVVWPEPDMPVVKSPKSLSRDVAIPPHILAPLLVHLDRYAAPGNEGLLFPAVESGGHMKHGALYKVFRRARKAAGRPDLRWHDLRHTGATLAAQAGATLAELMNRLGHTTVTAALIYQHAAAGRDAEIARRLSAIANAAENPTAV